MRHIKPELGPSRHFVTMSVIQGQTHAQNAYKTDDLKLGLLNYNYHQM